MPIFTVLCGPRLRRRKGGWFAAACLDRHQIRRQSSPRKL